MIKNLLRTLMVLLLVFGLTSEVLAVNYNVIDAGEAWPQEVVGTYTESGTNNGRACYSGPNGYWLYNTQWGGQSYWFIGKPLGNSDINHADVRFYLFGSNSTPPLNTNFFRTANALGAVQVTTSGGSPPSAPVIVHSITGSSTTISWADISTATGYEIDVSTSGSFSSYVSGYGPYVITIPEGTPFASRPISHVVSGLEPGTTYYFRMRAVNGFGESTNSNVVSTTTVPAPPTVQPATNVNDAGFRANWSSQSGATSYLLYVSTVSDFSSHIIQNQSVPTNYYTITELSPNTTYYYRVKAVNTSGQSTMSSFAQATTGPGIPGELGVTGIQSNTFTASWQGSAGALGYYIDVATNASFSNFVTGYVNLNIGNVTTCQVNQNLNPYSTYYLRVRAYSANGTSRNSEVVSVTTLPVTASVTTGPVTGIGFDRATVQGNITSLGAPNPTQHGIVWSTFANPTIANNKTEKGEVTVTGAFSSEVAGLHPNTTYYARAYVTNSAGTSYGEQVQFKTEKKALTITADAKSKTYGDPDPALTYQVTAGALVGSDMITGALTRVAGENADNYAIQQGTLTAGPNYDITFVGANLTIAAKELSVTAENKSKVYGTLDPEFTVSYDGFITGENEVVLGGELAITRASGEGVAAYTITPSGLTSSNYDLTFATGALTITPKALTITAGAKSKAYGDPDPALTYQVTAGALVGSDMITGALTRVAGENADNYAIQQGSLSAGPNYDITFVGANLTIAAKELSVTAENKTKVYGTLDPEFTVSYDGFITGENEAVLGGELAITRTSGEGVGAYTITPSGLTSSNYDLTFATGALTITPKALTITAGAKSKAYGDPDPALTYQVTAGALVGSDMITGALSRVAGENAGNYAIQQAALTAGPNYDITFVGASLTIAAKELSVTAENKSKVYGTLDPEFTVSYDGFITGENEAVLGGELAITRASGEGVGVYTITPSGLTSSNYDLTFATGALTITPKALVITANAQSKTYGDPDPALTYQVTAGVLVGSDSITGALARVAGENADNYAIQLGSLSAGSNYDIAYGGANLTIASKVLTITAEDKSKAYSAVDPEFTVNYDGFITGENETALVGELSFTREHGEDAGTYVITPSGLTSDNYDINFATGTLTILSNNADLSNLSLSRGTLSPVFGVGTVSYKVNVENSVNSITVTPTTLHSDSTITVNDMAVTSGQASGVILLREGANTINVVVTAQDRVTIKTYMITLNRAGAPVDDEEPKPKPTQTSIISGDSVEKTTVTTEEGITVETFTVRTEVQEQIIKAKVAGKTAVKISVASNQDATTVVRVPAVVLQSTAGMDMSVATPNATLELPADLVKALAAAGQDLSVTVLRGDAVSTSAQMSGIHGIEGATVLGTPTVINTAVTGNINVIIPLVGISIPTEAAERRSFLDSLAVFVIHSDGEKKVITGQIVYDVNGNPTSIKFMVDRFSTFSVIRLVNPLSKTILLTINKAEVMVDGQPYTLDAAPFIKPGVNRTLVPLRFVSEALGAQVEWLGETKQVAINDGDTEIILTLDSDQALINGQPVRLANPAELLPPGRTFVPLRFVSEALGAQVVWDAVKYEIAITRQARH